MFRIMHWFTSGLTIFKLAKTRRKGEIEVPMDTKTDFFGNSKNGGTKFEKVLLRVPILSVSWTDYDIHCLVLVLIFFVFIDNC